MGSFRPLRTLEFEQTVLGFWIALLDDRWGYQACPHSDGVYSVLGMDGIRIGIPVRNADSIMQSDHQTDQAVMVGRALTHFTLTRFQTATTRYQRCPVQGNDAASKALRAYLESGYCIVGSLTRIHLFEQPCRRTFADRSSTNASRYLPQRLDRIAEITSCNGHYIFTRAHISTTTAQGTTSLLLLSTNAPGVGRCTSCGGYSASSHR